MGKATLPSPAVGWTLCEAENSAVAAHDRERAVRSECVALGVLGGQVEERFGESSLSLGDAWRSLQVWFGGDTGYCSVEDETHDIDPSRPYCPAFKEIGERLGPFTLGLIPIGAYSPRHFMSPVHNAPIDAVRMFQDTVGCFLGAGLIEALQRGYRDTLGDMVVDKRTHRATTTVSRCCTQGAWDRSDRFRRLCDRRDEVLRGGLGSRDSSIRDSQYSSFWMH